MGELKHDDIFLLENMSKGKYLLPLTGRMRGEYAIVSAEDYDWAKNYKWHCNNKGMPCRSRGAHGLGREILWRLHGKGFKGVVRYPNKNPLDNRRCNLILTGDKRAKVEFVQEDGKSFVKMPVGNEGKVTLIDMEDHEWIKDLTLTLYKGIHTAYARCYPSETLLHREIMKRVVGRDLQSNERVRHVSNDGLDNRRKNLRIITTRQRT